MAIIALSMLIVSASALATFVNPKQITIPLSAILITVSTIGIVQIYKSEFKQ